MTEEVINALADLVGIESNPWWTSPSRLGGVSMGLGFLC